MSTIKKDDEWIEHEIQLRILAFQASDIYTQIKDLDKKIDTKFMWFYAIMVIPAILSIAHSIGWI